MSRIIGVQAAVEINDGVRVGLGRLGFGPQNTYPGTATRKNNHSQIQQTGPANLHLVFSGATSAAPNSVSRARFSPISRPAGSYHSWSECALPPLPPAPMEIASIPKERGMFASVEERSIRDSFSTIASAARK